MEQIIEDETRNLHKFFTKPLFFTYAPEECKHPYILRNIKQKPQNHDNFEIVDIGIYDLLQYPNTHPTEKIEAWKQLKTEGWKVVPDCPDLSGEFKIDVDFINTDYSWELLQELYDPSDVHQIPVIQSEYGNANSLRIYCEKFIEHYGKPEKIACGSICKMDSSEKTKQLLKIVRRYFPDTWIHAFGLKLNHFKKVKHLINSFDSTSWTFPRTPGRPSCKNKEQCIEYFYEYMDVVNSYVDLEGQKVLI